MSEVIKIRKGLNINLKGKKYNYKLNLSKRFQNQYEHECVVIDKTNIVECAKINSEWRNFKNSTENNQLYFDM